MDAGGLSIALITLPVAILQSIREIKDCLERFHNTSAETKRLIDRLDTLLICSSRLADLLLPEDKIDVISDADKELWNRAIGCLTRVVGSLQEDVHKTEKRRRARLAYTLGLDNIRVHETQLSRTMETMQSAVNVFNAYHQAGTRKQLSVIEKSIQNLVENFPQQDTRDVFSLGFHLERAHITPCFIQRREYSIAIRDTLLPEKPPGRKIFVLYGLGGIGKTQLAIRFAQDCRDEFSSIFFIEGSSKESLTKSFASIYRYVFEASVARSKSGAADFQPESMSVDEMMIGALQWLSQPANKNWLLILDNVDKEASDPGGVDIVSYFPPADHGSILITSRLAPLSRLGASKKVARMTDQEATGTFAEFLGDAADGSIETQSAKKKLLELLDGLPLAISQAARLISVLNLQLDTYLDLYSSSKREVIDMMSTESHSEGSEKGSIRTTWNMSLNLLKEKASMQGSESDPAAALRLLQLFAYFEPSDLSYNILRYGLIGNNVPDWFRRIFTSKVRFFAVIKILLDLCLIDNNVLEGSYSMHRVVHDWLCTYVSRDTDRELLSLAIAAISYAAPLVRTACWSDETQQLALHAVHVLPRVRDIVPEDFLVQYNNMNQKELEVVAELLDEPVKCWMLLKFDYSIAGIVRLLEGCGMHKAVSRLVQEVISSLSSDDRNMESTFIQAVMTYVYGRHLSPDDQGKISETFIRLGSPSWASKADNLRALRLFSDGYRSRGIRIWTDALYQSREDTGSVMIYPTSMIFANLQSRLAGEPQRRSQLFETVEKDAREERHRLGEARWIIQTAAKLRCTAAGTRRARGKQL